MRSLATKHRIDIADDEARRRRRRDTARASLDAWARSPETESMLSAEGRRR